MLYLRPHLLSFLALAVAHSGVEQEPIAGPHKSLWYNTLPGDGGTQVWQLNLGEAMSDSARPILFSLAFLRLVGLRITRA